MGFVVRELKHEAFREIGAHRDEADEEGEVEREGGERLIERKEVVMMGRRDAAYNYRLGGYKLGSVCVFELASGT